MTKVNDGEWDPGTGSTLRDLTADLRSSDLGDVQDFLYAIENVDKVLSALVKDEEVQVRRAFNVVEEYESSRKDSEESQIESTTLDYFVQKWNVEIQIEIRNQSAKNTVVDIADLHRFVSVFGSNPKTQMIALVWGTDYLSSVWLSIDDVLQLVDIGEDYLVPVDRLEPFHMTILSTLEELRPVYQDIASFQDIPSRKFMLVDFFSGVLSEKIEKLRATAGKRSDDRQMAINSISETDKDGLIELLARARIEPISYTDLLGSLEAFSEQIVNDSDDKDSNYA